MEESEEDWPPAQGHSAPPRPCIAMDLAQAVRRLVLREERKPYLSWLQLPDLGEEGAASRQEALVSGGGFLRMGKLGTKEVCLLKVCMECFWLSFIPIHFVMVNYRWRASISEPIRILL